VITLTEKRSDKHEHARSELPEELKPVFDDLVNDYKFFATKHHGKAFASYGVLAELVQSGWRLSAKPSKERHSSE